jgi:TPP-dependent 2-oxoacid decarboxylase
MLVTFSSKADMDVLMLEKHARAVLVAAGKISGPEIPERGVFTPEQIDQALTRLQQAIDQDNAQRPPEPDEHEDEDHEAARKAKEVVLLAQRAAPLMQMLRKARQANTSVMWETGSGW